MLTTERLLSVLLLLKAVDVVGRSPGPRGIVLVTLLALAAIGLFVRGASRTLWAGVLVACVGLAADFPTDLRRQHLVLLIGVALAFLVAHEPGERRLLLRSQLSALYAFAALSKVNTSFLSGDVLAQAALPLHPPLALLVAAGLLVIAVELALAVGAWSTHRWGFWLALTLHALTIPLLATTPSVGLRLVVFGGTAVVIYREATSSVTSRRARRPGQDRPHLQLDQC